MIVQRWQEWLQRRWEVNPTGVKHFLRSKRRQRCGTRRFATQWARRLGRRAGIDTHPFWSPLPDGGIVEYLPPHRAARTGVTDPLRAAALIGDLRLPLHLV